jgi:FdhD protein
MDDPVPPRRRAGRTERVLVRRIGGEERNGRTPDELIVEEPLTIRLDGTMVTTTMRTPGHDFELAAGFCWTEGLLGDAAILRCRYCGDESPLSTEYNVVSVETGGRAPEPTPRLGTTSSSCGLCGNEAIDELTARLAPLDVPSPFPVDLLAELPARAAAHQPLFDRTGAVHAAAVFDRSGRLLVAREDIGRHNAVDKVVGRLLLDARLGPGSAERAAELALFVSGRASFEMVQKAWAAGIGAVVAVSAPSALAVRTASAARLQLAGFARGGRLNLYVEPGGR